MQKVIVIQIFLAFDRYSDIINCLQISVGIYFSYQIDSESTIEDYFFIRSPLALFLEVIVPNFSFDRNTEQAPAGFDFY